MNSSAGPEQLEPAGIQQLHGQSTVTVTVALMKAKFLLVHWSVTMMSHPVHLYLLISLK